jgi:hypothetical protein
MANRGTALFSGSLNVTFGAAGIIGGVGLIAMTGPAAPVLAVGGAFALAGGTVGVGVGMSQIASADSGASAAQDADLVSTAIGLGSSPTSLTLVGLGVGLVNLEDTMLVGAIGDAAVGALAARFNRSAQFRAAVSNFVADESGAFYPGVLWFPSTLEPRVDANTVESMLAVATSSKNRGFAGGMVHAVRAPDGFLLPGYSSQALVNGHHPIVQANIEQLASVLSAERSARSGSRVVVSPADFANHSEWIGATQAFDYTSTQLRISREIGTIDPGARAELMRAIEGTLIVVSPASQTTTRAGIPVVRGRVVFPCTLCGADYSFRPSAWLRINQVLPPRTP